MCACAITAPIIIKDRDLHSVKYTHEGSSGKAAGDLAWLWTFLTHIHPSLVSPADLAGHTECTAHSTKAMQGLTCAKRGPRAENNNLPTAFAYLLFCNFAKPKLDMSDVVWPSWSAPESQEGPRWSWGATKANPMETAKRQSSAPSAALGGKVSEGRAKDHIPCLVKNLGSYWYHTVFAKGSDFEFCELAPIFV